MTEIVLRGFGPDGTPNTPEILLQGPVPANSSMVVDLSSRSGRALAMWTTTVESVGNDFRYAVVAEGASTATSLDLVGGVYFPQLSPVGSLLDSGGAITWNMPFFGSGALTNTAGVRLDPAFSIERTTSGPIDNELLVGIPRYEIRPQPRGQQLIVISSSNGLQWPEDTTAQDLTDVRSIGGTAPLAATTALHWRVPGRAAAEIVFSDRVLLLSGGPFAASSATVMWMH